MRFKEPLQAAEKLPVPAEVKSRRRAGRNNSVSPHLVTMLRNPTTVDVPTAPLSEVDKPLLQDDLAPTKGIILALVLSAPLWVIISATLWMVVR